MSAGGSISAMIASMKNNSRRKNKHTPFDSNQKKYKKSTPINSKEFTNKERIILAEKIKTDLIKENKQRTLKLIITFITTIGVIFLIIYLIKLIFI